MREEPDKPITRQEEFAPAGISNALRHNIKSYGILRTLARIIRKFFYKLEERSEHRFDKIHNIQTTGDVLVESLGLSKNYENNSENYELTPVSVVNRAINSIPYDLSTFAFIDAGSGKGRVLFKAAEFGFSEISGVELSQNLHIECLRNIENLKMKRQKCFYISSHNQDILEYNLPDEDIVLFMFNPFSENILSPLIDKLSAHHKRLRKKIVVIYYYPKHRRLFHRNNLFKTLPYLEPIFYFSVRYRWPVAIYESVE